MKETFNKKQVLYIILRQFAYFFVFIIMFFWANILTIISLFVSLFRQPLEPKDLSDIYNKNFGFIKKIL